MLSNMGVGPGLNKTVLAGSIILGVDRRAIAAPSAGDGTFYARISASTQDGTNLRWKYSWVELTLTTGGYGGWTDKTNGRSGTSNAYNLSEDINGTSGMLGNGVTVANLGTCHLKPAPTGAKVMLRAVVAADSSTTYWFSYENGVDS
jgi:hypothetical protein